MTHSGENARPHHYMNAGGFWHAGDMFEPGTPFVTLYDSDTVEQMVAQAKAEALREAGAKVAQMRHTISGRRVANAEWLGQVVYAMGDDIEFQAERAARKSRLRPAAPSEGSES